MTSASPGDVAKMSGIASVSASARLRKWGSSASLAFPIGAALSLAFAPFNVWPLAIACPAWLFFAWSDATAKRAARLGFLFSAGTFLAGTYWLYNSIYVIGKAPLPVTVLLMLGLIAIMGAYSALLGFIQARWFPAHGYARYCIALPAAWVMLEWLRGWLFSGFPWLSIGYAAIDTPLAAFAPLTGEYGVSFLLALTSGALAFLSLRHRQVAGYVVILVPWLLAYPLWYREWTTPIGQPITVAIVQGSVPQEMKWTQAQHDATLKLYRDLTVKHFGAQLIVWPESTLPDWAELLNGYLNTMWRDASEHGSSLIIGSQHYDAKKDKAYNSVMVLGENFQWYNKRHLVPFGEYFPVPSIVREWMRLKSLPHSDFASGDADQPPLRVAGQKIGVTICYEDAYGSSQLAALDEATLLINVTNDAWFGHSTARYQHLQISRMRALEVGRGLIRAANDGISAIIDAQGRLVRQLPSFKSEVLTGLVQPRSGLTFYARVGNWPVISLCAILLLFAIVRQKESV